MLLNIKLIEMQSTRLSKFFVLTWNFLLSIIEWMASTKPLTWRISRQREGMLLSCQGITFRVAFTLTEKWKIVENKSENFFCENKILLGCRKPLVLFVFVIRGFHCKTVFPFLITKWLPYFSIHKKLRFFCLHTTEKTPRAPEDAKTWLNDAVIYKRLHHLPLRWLRLATWEKFAISNAQMYL